MVVEVEYFVAYHLALAGMQRDAAVINQYKCMTEVFSVAWRSGDISEYMGRNARHVSRLNDIDEAQAGKVAQCFRYTD